ncbi:MAG TPA: hypothetical protein VNT75_07955 [Symbiobacteriaceae bacterium]|nr:hypothetical protein [Symbiobacteriaceae bacterium]
MSFSMFLGFITGMLLAGAAAVYGFYRAKKNGTSDQDERTEYVGIRAGNLTFMALMVFSFVAWVVQNVIRNSQGLDVAFFSPWGIMFFAGIGIYLAALWYENWKVSDPDAAPDDSEMKKMQQALGVLGASMATVGGASASLSDSISDPVHYFLVGFIVLLALFLGFTLAKMNKLRKKAQ